MKKYPWRNVPLPPLAVAARKEGKQHRSKFGHPQSQSLYHTCRHFWPQILRSTQVTSRQPPRSELESLSGFERRPQNWCDPPIKNRLPLPQKAHCREVWPRRGAVEIPPGLPLKDAWRQHVRLPRFFSSTRWRLHYTASLGSKFCRKPLWQNILAAETSSSASLVAFELLWLSNPTHCRGQLDKPASPSWSRSLAKATLKLTAFKDRVRSKRFPRVASGGSPPVLGTDQPPHWEPAIAGPAQFRSHTLEDPAGLEGLAPAWQALAKAYGPTEQFVWATSCLATLDAGRPLRVVSLESRRTNVSLWLRWFCAACEGFAGWPWSA